MSQSKQSLNEIRRGYAKKLKPLQIYALDSPDQDVPSIQVNRNNWNTIKSVFVTSLREELNELSRDATKKSFIKYHFIYLLIQWIHLLRLCFSFQ